MPYNITYARVKYFTMILILPAAIYYTCNFVYTQKYIIVNKTTLTWLRVVLKCLIKCQN